MLSCKNELTNYIVRDLNERKTLVKGQEKKPL